VSRRIKERSEISVTCLRLRLVRTVSVLTGIVCLAGCSDTERHRTLSFFFDGVPPLPGQIVEETVIDDTGNPQRKRVEPTWFVHEPQANCERCHGDQKQANFSRQVNLISPIPELCYECHDMPDPQKGWMHGPVAVGQCVICHEPHRSQNRYLLKKPEPQICFQCHEEAQIRAVPGHHLETYNACLDCHVGHQSFAKHLLRVDWVTPNARQGRTEPTGDPQFDGLVAKARSQIKAGQPLVDTLGTVTQHIEAANFVQARAWLMAIRLDIPFSSKDKQRLLLLEGRIRTAEKTVTVQQQADRRERAQVMAQMYYTSVSQYRSGRLKEARSGFDALLKSDVVPPTIKQAITQYLADINQRLSQERPTP
jgi:predicted CXXCH cytochrome family protein